MTVEWVTMTFWLIYLFICYFNSNYCSWIFLYSIILEFLSVKHFIYIALFFFLKQGHKASSSLYYYYYYCKHTSEIVL